MSSIYHYHLRTRANKLIRCPECLNHFKLRDYVNNHIVKVHGLDSKTQCPYCLGAVPSDDGKRNYKHWCECLKQFVKDYSVSDILPSVSDILPEENVEEMPRTICECKNFRSVPRQMFGRVKERLSEYVGFYDSVYERPDEYSQSDIQFSKESGLSEVYGIVKRYEEGDMKWCHAMVMHQNWNNFVESMKEIEDKMFILPYWCLCDGLGEKRKTHRHMIIAYEPESGFEELWRHRVKYSMPNHEKSKYLVKIKDTFHLVRTIAYVSQRKSSCDGQGISENEMTGENTSHFHINSPMHEHSIAYMCTTFEGGMEMLLAEQLKNKKVVGWMKWVVPTPDMHYNLKHAVPIGVTGFKFLNCVLPLNKRFDPSDEPTELYLTWLGDKKLFLKLNKNLIRMSRQEWYEYQLEKGNWSGYLDKELYVLGKTQQNVMNQINQAVIDTEKCEKMRLEKKYKKLKEKEEECERTKESYEKERQMYKELINQMKESFEKERQMYKELIRQMKESIEKERQLNEELIHQMKESVEKERQLNEQLIKREKQMKEWVEKERQKDKEWANREREMSEEIQNLKWVISTLKSN